jgi:hypothetical protein
MFLVILVLGTWDIVQHAYSRVTIKQDTVYRIETINASELPFAGAVVHDSSDANNKRLIDICPKGVKIIDATNDNAPLIQCH